MSETLFRPPFAIPPSPYPSPNNDRKELSSPIGYGDVDGAGHGSKPEVPPRRSRGLMTDGDVLLDPVTQNEGTLDGETG